MLAIRSILTLNVACLEYEVEYPRLLLLTTMSARFSTFSLRG